MKYTIWGKDDFPGPTASGHQLCTPLYSAHFSSSRYVPTLGEGDGVGNHPSPTLGPVWTSGSIYSNHYPFVKSSDFRDPHKNEGF